MHTYLLKELYISGKHCGCRCWWNNNANIKVVFKSCAQFTNCIGQLNNTQVDNTKDLGVKMPMCNLVGSNDNYSKIFCNLYHLVN